MTAHADVSIHSLLYEFFYSEDSMQGRIQDFKLGGGGGRALKKIAPSGGRREIFWGVSCEKSRFYAQKSYVALLRLFMSDMHVYGFITC